MEQRKRPQDWRAVSSMSSPAGWQKEGHGFGPWRVWGVPPYGSVDRRHRRVGVRAREEGLGGFAMEMAVAMTFVGKQKATFRTSRNNWSPLGGKRGGVCYFKPSLVPASTAGTTHSLGLSLLSLSWYMIQ